MSQHNPYIKTVWVNINIYCYSTIIQIAQQLQQYTSKRLGFPDTTRVSPPLFTIGFAFKNKQTTVRLLSTLLHRYNHRKTTCYIRPPLSPVCHVLLGPFNKHTSDIALRRSYQPVWTPTRSRVSTTIKHLTLVKGINATLSKHISTITSIRLYQPVTSPYATRAGVTAITSKPWRRMCLPS